MRANVKTLEALRLGKGLSELQVLKQSYVDRHLFSAFRAGNPDISRKATKKLAVFFGVKPSYLLDPGTEAEVDEALALDAELAAMVDPKSLLQARRFTDPNGSRRRGAQEPQEGQGDAPAPTSQPGAVEAASGGAGLCFVTLRGCCHICHEPVADPEDHLCQVCRKKAETECPDCGVQPGEAHFERCHYVGATPEKQAILRRVLGREPLPREYADVRSCCATHISNLHDPACPVGHLTSAMDSHPGPLRGAALAEFFNRQTESGTVPTPYQPTDDYAEVPAYIEVGRPQARPASALQLAHLNLAKVEGELRRILAVLTDDAEIPGYRAASAAVMLRELLDGRR